MMNATQLMPNVYLLGYRTGQRVSDIWNNRDSLPDLPTFQEIYDFVTRFPALYKHWWLNLVANDPVHVFVETTLLISIVYILVSRSKDWRELEKEKLTEKEKEDLLREWKLGRAPLTPTDDEEDEYVNDIVVHKLKGRIMEISMDGSDEVHSVLNFATFDFLGMSDEQEGAAVKEAAHKALDKYGCGSCGPRGFYGTIDVHLQLEHAFSEFCGTDGAILYSDGASTCSSTIAAFAKRGDLLVVDEGIYEPIMTGVTLSRAHVKWFKHNDMEDLRNVLEKVQATDRQLGRKPNAQRRFIVVEGLYKNTGTIVPLDELVKLKHEFSYRLILDESFSFGTLGKTGRGVAELYDKKLMYDAEIVTIAMENAVGSIGGLTVGTDEVVDHQRLSGSGYCFSASSPPFTATAAMQALEQIKTRPDLLQRLNDNRNYMYEKLQTVCTEQLEDLFLVTSDKRSPIILLQVADIPETEYLDELLFLREVVRESLNRGVAFVATGSGARGPVRTVPPPGIRMTVSAAQTTEDIDQALTVLAEAVDVVMTRFHEEAMS